MDWGSIVGPLLTSAAPTLAKALLGQIPIVGPVIAATAGDAIGAIIAKQFGVEPTPEAVDQAIKAAPAGEVEAKLAAAEAEAAAKWPALAEIARQDTEAFRAGVADNEAARQHTEALVEQGSPLAWGPIVISVVVVIMFCSLLIVWVMRPPTMSEASFTVVNLLVGTLVMAFGQVINFYLGSSASSRNKDYTLGTALISSQKTQKQALQTTTAAVSSVAKNAKPAPAPIIHARRD